MAIKNYFLYLDKLNIKFNFLSKRDFQNHLFNNMCSHYKNKKTILSMSSEDNFNLM